MKFGRARSIPDSRTLQLSSYVAVSSLPVPPVQEMLESTPTWPMLLNDKYNCCTSAAAGHMIHHWTATHQRGIFLDDNDVLSAYLLMTGGQIDQTVTMLNALKFWRKTGIGQHRVFSYMSSPPADASQLRCIVHLFGSAYVGLDLPKFAVSGPPTSIPDIPWGIPANVPAEEAKPLDDFGHCVAVIGYTPESLYAVSWGRLKTMSWDFFHRYNVETYAVLSPDWVQAHEACPSGFDLAQLRQDLTVLERPQQPLD